LATYPFFVKIRRFFRRAPLDDATPGEQQPASSMPRRSERAKWLRKLRRAVHPKYITTQWREALTAFFLIELPSCGLFVTKLYMPSL
jgi:hypothetical protein